MFGIRARRQNSEKDPNHIATLVHKAWRKISRQQGAAASRESKRERCCRTPGPPFVTGHGGQAAIGGAQVCLLGHGWSISWYQAHVREHGSSQSLIYLPRPDLRGAKFPLIASIYLDPQRLSEHARCDAAATAFRCLSVWHDNVLTCSCA